MALVKCPECGKEMSDRAAACPHCGNPLEAASAAQPAVLTTSPKPPQKQISPAVGCLILIGIIVFVGFVAGWCASPSDSGKSASTTPDLSAAVRFTGTQFVITNNDDFAWSNCKLEINSGVVRGGYELKTAHVAAHATVTVGAMQFAKSEGERFNPFTMKPNNLFISCDTPKGPASYYGGW